MNQPTTAVEVPSALEISTFVPPISAFPAVPIGWVNRVKNDPE
jgi:hypothetical protein